MTYADVLTKIDQAYAIISERIAARRAEYIQSGILSNRISYEDISLEYIMETLLLPLLPELIDSYLAFSYQYKRKVYRIYVATLCELVKNGLVNGGILKTMESRMGTTFDRNHHYDLLNWALSCEGIPLLVKNGRRQYEETIINEAGIPRNYHKTCLEIFTIYWKWLRNYEFAERKNFLECYFEDRPVDKNYIVDQAEASTLTILKAETKNFSHKIIETCIKLDRTFSAIDSYSNNITEDNLDEVAKEISALVGFNIFSVVRSESIKKYILAYAKRVSFKKFERFLDGMASNEEIILPNGCKRKIAEYPQHSYLGGRHIVRGNAYDVSYPISFSVNEFFDIPVQKIQMLGNAVLYTSDEPIDVEVDGIEKTARLFLNDRHECLYVFYERIAPASFAYIDGVPVEVTRPFSKKTYIGKFWDFDVQQYQLGLMISEICYADRKKAMKPVAVICNDTPLISASTNSNGAFRVQDKIYRLQDRSLNQDISLSFIVDEKSIESWSVHAESFYFWNKQTGIRIHDKIEVSDWNGPAIGLCFSRNSINHCSAEYKYLYSTQGYNVYEININFSAKTLEINEYIFPIIQSEHPYLSLNNQIDVISGEYCIEEREPLSISILNYQAASNDCYLLIEHDMAFSSYNLRNIGPEDLRDITCLVNGQGINGKQYDGKSGKWRLSIVQNNRCISELNVVVIPYLMIRMDKAYYSEGENITVSMATKTPCFESGGEYVSCKEINIGSAAIEMKGNHVGAKPIEFDCYIDKCGITKHLRVFPYVWGLRCKDLDTNLWEEARPHDLVYSELQKRQLFICSTVEVLINIATNDAESKRCVQPGFNRVNLRSLIFNWTKYNEICFVDEYEKSQNIQVTYLTKIFVLEVVRSRTELSIQLEYNGPTGSTLNVRVFSGAVPIAFAERKAYYNNFQLRLWIPDEKLYSSSLSVEARIDRQDYQVVYQGICPAQVLKRGTLPFSFNRDTGIIELLTHAVDVGKSVGGKVRAKSLISLISGENSNDN